VGAWKGAGSISQRSAAHLAGSTTKIEPVEADARAKGGRRLLGARIRLRLTPLRRRGIRQLPVCVTVRF
jgi:hypothetical protein